MPSISTATSKQTSILHLPNTQGQTQFVSDNVLSLIAGPFAEQVSAIWANRIFEYLGATDRRRHLWHAWLSQNTSRNLTQEVEEVYNFLSFAKSKIIASDGFGNTPAGFIPALGRLGATACQPAFYLALHRVLSIGGRVAKLIHHMQALDHETITMLASVPRDDLNAVIIQHLIDRSVEPSKIPAMLWMIGRLKTVIGGDVVDETVLSSGNPVLAVHQKISGLSFPISPWPEMGLLKPVTSAAHLRAIGHEHNNCLTDFHRLWDAVLSVLSRHCYFYEWRGEQPALIMFNQFAGLGWVITEAYSKNSRRLAPKTRAEIGDLIFANPNICPVWPDRSLVPTLSYYFDRA